MNLKYFKIRPHNHFIAMEYYGLILNRTFLVLIAEDFLIGIKVRGVTSAESGEGLTRTITRLLAVQDNLDDPYSYIKTKYLNRLKNCDFFGADLFVNNRANFRIKRTEIVKSYHDPKKKWGMSYYPHMMAKCIYAQQADTKENL